MIAMAVASQSLMEHIMIRSIHTAAVSAPSSFRGVSSRGLLSRIGLLLPVASERKALSAMSQERLEDMGLTREAAWTEASRPFWDAPNRA